MARPYSLGVHHTEYILIAPQGKVKEIYIKTRRKIPQRREKRRIFAPVSPLTEKKQHDKMFPHADVVELVDSLDLGSNAQACRFESCHPHQISTMVLIRNHRAFSILIDFYTAI